MFNSLSIARKLWVMVLVPLAALAAIAGLSAWTVISVRVGGDGYNRIERNQVLIADVLPPPLFLVEAQNAADEAALAWDPASGTYVDYEVAQARTQWEVSKRHFNERKTFWLDARRRRTIDPSVRTRLEENVYTSGDLMIAKVDQELFRAIDANNEPKVREIEEAVDILFAKHKFAVDTMVTAAEKKIVAEKRTIERALTRRAALIAGLVATALALLALLSVTVARAISRPLRRLTDTAKVAASTELPRVVDQLQTAGPGDEVAPPPVFAVTSKDEVGELAEALNSMQSTAVRLAGDQATMRRNVQETFVNLGRRNQGLLNRTLSFITDLEQNERDPDTLENLFRLDHLATRMRRNAESLLVLAGTNPTRTWTQPVAMGDVVRSALSEIEAYSRVEYKHVQRVSVRGNVVSDLAHLLAELIENATNFSAPHTRVHVAGRLLQDAYVLQVVDSGVGMGPRDLADANRRLETVSELEATPSKVLGLFVVGRLAARHGLQVTLTTAPTDGVAAVIRIPLNLVELTGGSPATDDVMTSVDDLAGRGKGYGAVAGASQQSEDLARPADRSTATERSGADRADSDRSVGARGVAAAPVAAPPAWVSASAAPPAGVPAPAGHHLDRYVQVVPPTSSPARSSSAGGPAQAARPSALAPQGAAMPDLGLRKRVKGAQLPDVGGPAQPATLEPRDADSVRNALSSFQRGVAEGRSGDS